MVPDFFQFEFISTIHFALICTVLLIWCVNARVSRTEALLSLALVPTLIWATYTDSLFLFICLCEAMWIGTFIAEFRSINPRDWGDSWYRGGLIGLSASLFLYLAMVLFAQANYVDTALNTKIYVASIKDVSLHADKTAASALLWSYILLRSLVWPFGMLQSKRFSHKSILNKSVVYFVLLQIVLLVYVRLLGDPSGVQIDDLLMVPMVLVVLGLLSLSSKAARLLARPIQNDSLQNGAARFHALGWLPELSAVILIGVFLLQSYVQCPILKWGESSYLLVSFWLALAPLSASLLVMTTKDSRHLVVKWLGLTVMLFLFLGPPISPLLWWVLRGTVQPIYLAFGSIVFFMLLLPFVLSVFKTWILLREE